MRDPTITVQFDPTFDELIDVELRFLRSSKAASAWRRNDAIFAAVGAALLTFFAIQILTHATLLLSLLGTSVGALIGYKTYPRDQERRLRRRLMRLLKEQLGEVQSIRCDVELGPHGITVRQQGRTITYSWSNVKEIHDTPHGVEFRFAPGLLVVRSRAFPDQAARDQFLTQARALAHQAAA
jgi:hypothetical protein